MYLIVQEELVPMKDRVHREIVDKFHMSATFTTAKKETMMEVMEYIEQRYVHLLRVKKNQIKYPLMQFLSISQRQKLMYNFQNATK